MSDTDPTTEHTTEDTEDTAAVDQAAANIRELIRSIAVEAPWPCPWD